MADDAGGVAAVLGAVGGVEFIAQLMTGIDEGHVLADAARLDMALKARPGAAGPV